MLTDETGSESGLYFGKKGPFQVNEKEKTSREKFSSSEMVN
jgi:hypothetical protein